MYEEIIISACLSLMEMYAGHRGTFSNWLNIYKTNINSTAVNVGSCNNSVEGELSILVCSSDQFTKNDLKVALWLKIPTAWF